MYISVNVSVFTCIVVLCPKKYQFWSQSCGFWSHSSTLRWSPPESSHSCRSQWGTEKYWLGLTHWPILSSILPQLGFRLVGAPKWYHWSAMNLIHPTRMMKHNQPKRRGSHTRFGWMEMERLLNRTHSLSNLSIMLSPLYFHESPLLIWFNPCSVHVQT